MMHTFPDYVTEEKIQAFIKAAFIEDVGPGDHTSLACIPKDKVDKARLLVKADGILAGVTLADYIFKHADPNAEIEYFMKDGDPIKYGDEAFYVTSNAQALLQAERLVLNAMQRMSGIATFSKMFSDAVAGLPVKILDTRKTTPLLRFLEKWAVTMGGCNNYRFALYDWIMIKDNHIDACGGIIEAIEATAAYQKAKGLSLGVTVEVRDMKELDKVLKTGKVTQIMLDNFDIPTTEKAVKLIDKRFNVEASGGITLDTIRSVAETGVDFISVGALTHSYRSLDLSLKVMK